MAGLSDDGRWTMDDGRWTAYCVLRDHDHWSLVTGHWSIVRRWLQRQRMGGGGGHGGGPVGQRNVFAAQPGADQVLILGRGRVARLARRNHHLCGLPVAGVENGAVAGAEA